MRTKLLFSSTCWLLCIAQNVLAWDRPLIKSYETERKVFDLCHQSDELMNTAACSDAGKKSSLYGQALDKLRQAVAYDPSSYSSYAHENMAECYCQLKQFQQAVDECKKALSIDPNYKEAYYELALVYYCWEHYDSAIHYLQKLSNMTADASWKRKAQDLLHEIETYGKAHSAFNEMKKGNLSKARQLYMDAAKQDPSPVSGNVHSNLAWVLRNLGKPEEAIEEYKKALKFTPDDKDDMYGLAVSNEDMAQFDEAISWMQRYAARESDPEKRQRALEHTKDMLDDRKKINTSYNNLPDYLEHNMGDCSTEKWPLNRLPLKIFIRRGDGISGYKSNYPSFVKRALDTWCNASGNKLSYQITKDSESADLEIAWIDKPIVLEDSKRKRVKQGVADIDSDEHGIDHVLVQVDCMNSFEPSKELEETETASVCMHEIGHSLGLPHSTNVADVMYYSGSSKQTGFPTARDKASIAKLYLNYPVSKLAPAASPEQGPEVRYLPPPSFMPQASPSDEDCKPPVFLPPPIPEENEILTPPFFKPPPIAETETKAPGTNEKAPAPPMFIPQAPEIDGTAKHKKTVQTSPKPGANAGEKEQKKRDSKPNSPKAGDKPERRTNPVFFIPPPSDK